MRRLLGGSFAVLRQHAMLLALATAVNQAPAVLYEPMRTEARLQVVIGRDNVTLQATAGPGAARRGRASAWPTSTSRSRPIECAAPGVAELAAAGLALPVTLALGLRAGGVESEPGLEVRLQARPRARAPIRARHRFRQRRLLGHADSGAPVSGG